MKIVSEEPSIHWWFLNVKDKIVLDLGCGLFCSRVSTPDYFIENNAKKVIGVDLGGGNFNFTYHQMRVDSTEKLQFLLDKYKPEVIKCDIEGAEVYFDGILDIVADQFAVEYHDNDLKLLMEKKIKEWGLVNTKTYQLFDENINRIGVIYAWK